MCFPNFSVEVTSNHVLDSVYSFPSSVVVPKFSSNKDVLP